MIDDDSKMKQFSSKYFNLIHQQYSGLNLTAIKEFDTFHEQQVVDSIYPFINFPKALNFINQSSLVIDLGCGGGVPLIPLAWKFPHLEFLGIDSKKKKAIAVKEMAELLMLTNIKTIGERMERIFVDTPNVSVLVKAVGKIADVLSYIQSSEKVRVFFYKGSNWEHLEIAQSKRIHNNWKLEEIFKMNFSNLGERYLLMYEGLNRDTKCGKDSILLSTLKNMSGR